jgi:hypothetical protein
MQQLEAHEKPLAKIFCGDYDFQVYCELDPFQLTSLLH